MSNIEKLFQAAKTDDAETVKNLIAAGADVNSATDYYRDPLVAAVNNNCVDAARALLDAGANVNRASSIIGDTVLMTAADRGNISLTRLLLEKGADVNASNKEGNTALLEAVHKVRIGVIRLLLDAGADVNAANKIGKTPLIEAVCQGNMEITHMLLQAGANVNHMDTFGWTALGHAKDDHDSAIVDILRKHGATIEPSDIDDLAEEYEKIVDNAYQNLLKKAADRVMKTIIGAMDAGLRGDELNLFVNRNIYYVAKNIVLSRDDGYNPNDDGADADMVNDAISVILDLLQNAFKDYPPAKGAWVVEGEGRKRRLLFVPPAG